eukprot:133183-Chlamydomonas_euryale.AAC.1
MLPERQHKRARSPLTTCLGSSGYCLEVPNMRDPSPSEDSLERQLAVALANNEKGDAELARLRKMLAEAQEIRDETTRTVTQLYKLIS